MRRELICEEFKRRVEEVDKQVEQLEKNPLLFMLMLLSYWIILIPSVFLVTFGTTLCFMRMFANIVAPGFGPGNGVIIIEVIPLTVSFIIAGLFLYGSWTLAPCWVGLLWKIGVLVRMFVSNLRMVMSKGKDDAGNI